MDGSGGASDRISIVPHRPCRRSRRGGQQVPSGVGHLEEVCHAKLRGVCEGAPFDPRIRARGARRLHDPVRVPGLAAVERECLLPAKLVPRLDPSTCGGRAARSPRVGHRIRRSRFRRRSAPPPARQRLVGAGVDGLGVEAAFCLRLGGCECSPAAWSEPVSPFELARHVALVGKSSGGRGAGER